MLQKAWRQVRWSVAQRGLWGMLRVMASRGFNRKGASAVVVHPFDEEFGVETSGLIGGGELAGGGVNDRYNTAYHGAPPARFREALKRWEETPGTGAVGEYTFVDMGCGKGRAVLMASEMPFREVLGVELNAGLVAVAERNLQRWDELGLRQCPSRVLQGDAAEFLLPEAPLLVYLYNPFRAPVMRMLLERLEAVSGRVDILYLVPEQEVVFTEFESFARVWSVGMEGAEAVDQVSSSADRVSLYRR
jgi:SAM-dependent methyltransferase